MSDVQDGARAGSTGLHDPVNHGGVARSASASADREVCRTRHFWRVRCTARRGPCCRGSGQGAAVARPRRAGAGAREDVPHAPAGDEAKASRTMGSDILDSPALAVDEGDGDLDHPAALADQAVGHLDLEAVAVGPHVAEVEPTQGVGPVGAVARRRVVDGQAERRARRTGCPSATGRPAAGSSPAIEPPATYRDPMATSAPCIGRRHQRRAAPAGSWERSASISTRMSKPRSSPAAKPAR